MDNSYYGNAGSILADIKPAIITIRSQPFCNFAGTLILRLSHLYEVGEDAVLSQPATVALDQIFSFISIQSCTETSVTANQKVRYRFVIAIPHFDSHLDT